MTQHAEFWLPLLKNPKDIPTSGPQYVSILHTIQRAVANYVRIVTKKSIPVTFYKGDVNFATADGKIFLTAIKDFKNVDFNIGLSLHEASHIILSNRTDIPESIPLFDLLKSMVISDPWWKTKEKDLGRNALEDMKLVLNVLEDRRIDHWMYQRAVGYRPYYQALYHTYWHSKDVAKTLAAKESRTPSVRNYFTHLINVSHPNADRTALPALDVIFDAVNLPNITRLSYCPKWEKRFTFVHKWHTESAPAMLQAAHAILYTIYNNAVHDSTLDEDPTEKMVKFVIKVAGTSEGITMHTNPKQKLSDIDAETLTQIEVGSLKIHEVGGSQMPGESGIVPKLPCAVYEYIPAHNPSAVPFYNTYERANTAVVQQGDRMGTLIANRLQVMQEATPITYGRQQRGQLDKGRIHALGYDDPSVFAQTVIESKKPVALHLSLDGSGSMKGAKWDNAIQFAVSLAKAASIIKTLHITISIRDAISTSVRVAIVYDSKKNSFAHIKKYFPQLHPASYTPEGLAFEVLHGMFNHIDRDAVKYFINLSDGMPYIPLTNLSGTYQGTAAITHTAEQIRKLIRDDVNVLSYFITEGAADDESYSEAIPQFKQMYGARAKFINVADIAQVTHTLNRLFLTP